MTAAAASDLFWQVRHFVYTFITEHERPPADAEIAARFGLEPAAATRLVRELHDRHALLLDPQTGTIRMANPYSGVPTRYRVVANGHRYWANCAWDALGIPAMLGADAEIHASCADNDQPITLRIEAGRCEPAAALIHFPLPFVRWYDDLVVT